ncbi:MAG TPA: ribonuclease E/G, partial [Arenimonas sp.]|nr:ribonuclease E/G [Arenimonas sp.]
MSSNEELLINVTPRETRVALVENGLLQELQIERSSRRGVLGNIYKGRVQRVMPGMQAAFVDIGLERTAFLHANDISQLNSQPIATESGITENKPQPLITSLVHEGQEVIVQVIKDPIGSKGARLTTEISIPSRYLVMLHDSQFIGVSSRIENEDERQRLKLLLQSLTANSGSGYIIRTNAEGVDESFIAQDVAYLKRAIGLLNQRKNTTKVGECIYDDLSLPM